MPFEYSPLILPLIVTNLISLSMAVYLWPHRQASGALPLFFLALSLSTWTTGYALEIAGVTVEAKYIGIIQYIGIPLAPYTWLIFALSYSGQAKLLTYRFLALLGAIPALTVLFGLTTKWHGLVWATYGIDPQGNYPGFVINHGPWFWVHFVYSYLIIFIGTLLFVRVLWHRPGIYRRQMIALLVGVFVPWLANILYFTNNSPIPQLDLTPFSFTISLIALAWGSFGHHLGSIMPIARDLVVEGMRDGMIVLDLHNRIVDMNPAAAQHIGFSPAMAIGKDAGDIFSPWPHLIDRFRNVNEANEEIVMGQGNAQRRYQLRFFPFSDSQNKRIGRIIILRLLEDGEPFERPSFNKSRFASQPISEAEERPAETPPTSPTSLKGRITNFFSVPLKLDLPLERDMNPSWYQTRERIFTIVARTAATLGIASLVLTLFTNFGLSDVYLIFAVILLLLMGLGLARHWKYEYRVTIFLALVYSLGMVEVLNFGFSVESFIFFICFVMLAAVFVSQPAVTYAILFAIATLGLFTLLIGSGFFTPYVVALEEGIASPVSIANGFNSLLVFTAGSSVVVVSIVILLKNLNLAWQKETQALHLLRQERNLLDQRVAEQTVELRKYFRAIEQSANAIVITNEQGEIEYVNPRFENSSGYSLAEAKGKKTNILKSGKQGSEFYSELWTTIKRGESWQGLFHNKRKDGSLYWESTTIAPILNEEGAITNYVAVKEDITHQKEMEDALRQAYQSQSVLNSLLSLALEHLTLNEMLERALDVILTIPWLTVQPKGGIFLVGDRPGHLLLKAQRHLADSLQTMCACIPFGRCLCGLAASSHQIQFAGRIDERHEIHYETMQPHGHYNIPILFRGEVLGVIVLYLEENRLENPREFLFLEAIANTLAAMIRDKQTEEALAIARDQALEANQFKSQMLAWVSHDLRTPLSSVLGYAELLQGAAFGELSDQQRDLVTRIINNAHYLNIMVNDLLDGAQIETRTLSLNYDPFSPADLVERVKETLLVLATRKGLPFTTELSPDLPAELYGDVNRLQQIIINLAANAIKFTKTGDVQLTIFSPDPKQWAIEVKDSGEGIPVEAQQYIFEPFRQIKNDITRANRGSGLGLSITKQLVELMNGQISLESEVGKGSIFTVSLPILTPTITP